MATMTTTKKAVIKAIPRQKPIPRALRARAEQLLAENYPFMDSETFKQRGLEQSRQHRLVVDHERPVHHRGSYQRTDGAGDLGRIGELHADPHGDEPHHGVPEHVQPVHLRACGYVRADQLVYGSLSVPK